MKKLVLLASVVFALASCGKEPQTPKIPVMYLVDFGSVPTNIVTVSAKLAGKRIYPSTFSGSITVQGNVGDTLIVLYRRPSNYPVTNMKIKVYRVNGSDPLTLKETITIDSYDIVHKLIVMTND